MRMTLAIAAALLATAASAQTMQNEPAAPPAPPAATTGAGIDATTARKALEGAGYADIQEMTRKADGSWEGKASRNGRQATVTVLPDGTVSAPPPQ